MIGSVKKLISGVLSFLFGLLGGKKTQEIQPESKPVELPGKVTGKTKRRTGFYLELNENEENKAVAAQLSAVTNGAKTTGTTPTATQPVNKAQSAKTEAPTNNQPATAASANNQPVKVELVQTAEGLKAQPVKPEKAPAASKNGQAPTETTFAPKYLTPTNSNGRRRPGPNMSTYLDMARQVKPSS